jgi:hypothetical protein
LLRGERFRKFGTEPFNKEFSERNKITEVLLRSVMKKGTLRENAGAFDILIAVRGGVFGCALPVKQSAKQALDEKSPGKKTTGGGAYLPPVAAASWVWQSAETAETGPVRS